ncbi:MAG: hypothetical protein EZS28_026191, partial [Streblomastix strix]
LATKRKTLTCVYSYRDFKISTDSTEAWVYIDEALLDAAGLMDFPELYAYIKERDPKPPIETAPPVPVGEQTLQEQVKINADILENTNEVFVPPEPNMPVKIDYGQQIVNKPFIFNEMQPTLIIYGDRVTLNCFLTIKQQFKGYVFNSYPQEAQPKDNVKIITVICNNFSNNTNLFCYIDENGPYVYAEDDREIAANTSIVISTTYYKQFEALKQINYDSNNDGKVDIMDVWNGSGQGTHATQSHVYDVVKKQSDLVDHHIEGTVLHNFLNNDIKLIDKLGIYKADRAAYYVQDGPIVTFSFGAKLGDNIGNIYKIFSTIDNKILPPYAKYHAMHPEQKEFKGYCQQIQQLDKSQGFQVIISGKLDKKDCEFSGQLEIVQGFNLGSPHNSFYIVDDGTCKVLSSIPDELVPLNNNQLVFPATIMITVGDSYQTDTFVGYFIVNGSTKQYSFSVDRPVVISPQSSNLLYYCVSGLTFNNMAVGIFHKIKQLVSKVGHGLSWVNDHVVKPYVLPAAKQFSGIIPGGGLIMKGIEAGSSALDAFSGQGSKQDAKDKFNDLMDDPYLRNLPIESLSRLIKLRGGQS